MRVSLQRQRGLTLVELLIALSLTVMISALAYQFLDVAVQVDEQAEANFQNLMALEQVFALISDDLEHLVDRSVVKPAVGLDPLALLMAASGAPRPALLSTTVAGQPLSSLTGRDGALLWFTRQGWVNPASQHRSELMRVLYRLDEERNLWRDYWPERNQPLAQTPLGSQLLLQNVAGLELGYLPPAVVPESSNWLSEWSIPAQTDTDGEAEFVLPVRVPAAIRVVIRNDAVGTVQRTFLVKGG